MQENPEDQLCVGDVILLGTHFFFSYSEMLQL
jgi:hypothetical protein